MFLFLAFITALICVVVYFYPRLRLYYKISDVLERMTAFHYCSREGTEVVKKQLTEILKELKK